jgi:hypothetical protein
MKSEYSNLSYEFYYLLRTEIEPDGKLLREPPTLSALRQSSKDGMLADQGKERLFRIDTHTFRSYPPVSVDEWQNVLTARWENILACYTEHFDNDKEKARSFCNQALLGVIMLICDAELENLEQYKISVPLQKAGNIPDEAVFQLVPEDDPEHCLLKISHHPPDNSRAITMPGPAVFTAFRTTSSTLHCQLKIDTSVDTAGVRLIPMEGGNAANPVFSVYGLAHGNVAEAEEQGATWHNELQDFLEGKLVRMIPHLLIRQWQFARIDAKSIRLRQRLRGNCDIWSKSKDDDLFCLSAQELSKELQDMATLQAEAKNVKGFLQKSVKTLEIHRNNLMRVLRRANKDTLQWKLDWQDGDEIALTDGFNSDIRKLQNHLDYIEGDLTRLEGIRSHWYLHFEGRGLASSQQLAISASILTIIAAVATVFSILPSFLNMTPYQFVSLLKCYLKCYFQQWQAQFPIIALLTHPAAYWLMIILCLFPVSRFFAEKMIRKLNCWKRRLQKK